MRGRERRRELPGIYLAVFALGAITHLIPVAPDAPVLPAAAPSPVVTAPPAAPIVRSVPVPITLPGPRQQVLNDLPSAGKDRTILLTFDDGPDPTWTPQVLEVLQRYGAVATFCMVSNQVPDREKIVEQVVAAGMGLCDHTRSHDEQLPTRPLPQITDEIVGARTALTATGHKVGFFRAPAGNWSPTITRIAAEHGMQPLGWSVDPRDWERPGVAAIVSIVQEHVHPGAIVLLHDGGGHRAQTVAALEQLLPWLIKNGYRFGRLNP